MLFLPAAALCCLCSALAGMATQLNQEDLTLTRRRDESVSFSCGGTEQCDGNYVYWYQKKDSETFRAILYISQGGSPQKRFSHPQQNDFSAERYHNSCTLKINKVTDSHSASYYCGCITSSSWEYLFGSGTKLYVTDVGAVKPVVTVCKVKTDPDVEGKTALMCLASAMIPPEVQISWKRKDKKSEEEETLPADQTEVTMTGRKKSAAIRLINKDHLNNYEYACVVRHEGSRITKLTPFKELPAPTTSSAPTTTSPVAATPGSDPPAASVPPQLNLPVSFQSQSRVKLLCLLYTVLIVKSLVYCSGLSLLMMLRNKEPST